VTCLNFDNISETVKDIL